MPVKNYVFGAFPPTTNRDNVADQMRAAHRYRNRLVELELARRAAAEATIRRLSPTYAALAEAVDAAQADVDAAYEAVTAGRQKARARLPITPEQQQAIDQAAAVRDSAIEAAKLAKKAAYELLQSLQQPIRDQAAAETDTPATRKQRYLELAEAANLDSGQAAYDRATKQARADCGCYWGTYLTIEDAASKLHIGPPPRFQPYTGEGTIAVQFQGGLPVETATAATDTRLQIELANAEELAVQGRSGGLRSRGTVRLRIGSDGRAPIWTEFQASFHRPLPARGVIKWAYLHRRRIGTHDKWSLRLTIDDHADPRPVTGSGIVAVHPGWRMMPDGSIRVATVVDTSGHLEEFCLPAELLQRHEKPDSLQAIRDRRNNLRAPRLVAWLKAHTDILPDWIREATETIGQWKSAARFAGLALQWCGNRFPGDELAFGLLERWRKHDKHLYDWQAHQRAQVIRHRRDLYRVFARRLADKYAWIVVPKVDWSALRRRQTVDEEHTQTNRQRRISSLASPGLLMEFFAEAAAGRQVVVPAKHITGECQHCGQVDKWDRSRREHTCTMCARRWDQDHNAAQVQLARGLAVGQAGAAETDPPDQAQATARKSRRNRRRQQLLE